MPATPWPRSASPQGLGQGDLGGRGQGDDGAQGQSRRRDREDRRHRAGHQARCPRLHDLAGRVHRAEVTLRAPGPDLLRRARHHLCRPADAGFRHPAGRHRQTAGRAEEARARAQGHADHRPQPRHPCRTDDFGVKLAGHYAAFVRNRARLVAARAEIATCAISGPVGTFANVDPRIEEHVADKLGLAVEPVSTQVIPRDRHAAFFAALGVVASSVENLATEIRHLQRTEVREAEEFFSTGPEGQLVDAAQAQSGADRERHRPRTPGPRRGGPGARERDPVARARHLALLDRALHRARRHRHARLRPQPHGASVVEQLVDLSRAHEGQPQFAGRPRASPSASCWPSPKRA